MQRQPYTNGLIGISFSVRFNAVVFLDKFSIADVFLWVTITFFTADLLKITFWKTAPEAATRGFLEGKVSIYILNQYL